jgi:hypothetical protein
MRIVESNIKWIMLVAGALTCTMVYAAIAPQAALLSTFGETLDGPLADIVVRNWGALITLIGAMLIWGAFNPQVRNMALMVAGASKVVFIALVLSHGGRYLGRQAGLAIAIDLVWVVLFAWYLLSARAVRV